MADVLDEFHLWDCGPCAEHYFNNPHLIHAASSVGIEHGKSTGQILREYLDDYHRRGHKKISTPATETADGGDT